MRTVTALLTAVAVISATGCDSSGQAAPASAEQPTAESSPAPLGTCDFLVGALPRLRDAGSDLGARAQLNVEYANFLGRQPSTKLINAAKLDAETTRDCPGVRTQVLKVVRVKAFTGLA